MSAGGVPPGVEGDVAPGEWLVPERDGLGACFGCGRSNPHGLQLRFRTLADGRTVETRLRPEPHFAGVDGVLHGGIQSTVLDEVMGVAAQFALPALSTRAPCVTAELSVRFLRPVTMDAEVVARARVVRVDGADLYVHGEIVAGDGAELTTARSRWRQLPPGGGGG
jgi:uncharacterized protein (TIGR00369 family)